MCVCFSLRLLGYTLFILLVPLIYIVPHLVEDPTLGVYLAEPIADVLAVAFTTVLFLFQFKKALKAIETPTEV